jgi:hypothetical protein
MLRAEIVFPNGNIIDVPVGTDCETHAQAYSAVLGMVNDGKITLDDGSTVFIPKSDRPEWPFDYIHIYTIVEQVSNEPAPSAPAPVPDEDGIFRLKLPVSCNGVQGTIFGFLAYISNTAYYLPVTIEVEGHAGRIPVTEAMNWPTAVDAITIAVADEAPAGIEFRVLHPPGIFADDEAAHTYLVDVITEIKKGTPHKTENKTAKAYDREGL